jgi:hypothetical protein
LRQAVAAANVASGNTVEFDPALAGSTITLTSGEIPIHQSMGIYGLGQDRLTISGNNVSRIFNVSPLVSHVPVIIGWMTLTQGKSTGDGGAINATDAGLRLYHTTIKASNALGGGGGIFVEKSYVVIGYLRIEGNHAAFGGGLDAYSCPGIGISSSTIRGNTADYLGGGIYGFGEGTFQLQDSTISGNVVPQPSQYGPGARGGGGISLNSISGVSHFENSTITQNYAYTGGGGVALLDASAGNTATFYQTTIVGNSAQAYDTGIGITAKAGKPLISASIVANNFSQSSADDLAGSFTANNSLIKSPGAATVSGTGSLIGSDPQLGPLADNGGATLTLLPSATSPVIDKAPCSSTCVLDQRGALRSHPNADMGAVERQFPEQLIFRNGFDPT